MSISIVRQGDFSKFNVTTGAGTFNLPREDVSALYGPGWPVAPVTRPEDTDLPREIDYPVAINATLQPRIGYEGLMPVRALKAAYTNVAEVGIPINLIIREMAAFIPMLRDKKKQQRVGEDHPYNWLTVSPDRVNPWSVWMARYKKSAKLYAAPAFFYRRDSSGAIDALEYIDGSTLFLIVNARGRLPEPNEIDPELKKYVDRLRYYYRSGDSRVPIPKELPSSPFDPGKMAGVPIYAKDYLTNARKRAEGGKELPTTTPAFTQIIKGIPFSFWDKSQIYFIPEPPAPAVDSPYGETFIERSWTWIQIIAVMTAFELGHYRTGNMPEGFATMPKDWFPTMARLASAEREFNARMAEGTQTQHSRIRFGPDGMKWIPTKKPDFPRDLYKQARDNILYAIGVPASELGETPGKGLGGAGFEQGKSHDVTRQILEAEKSSLENAFNRVLLMDGVNDVEFYMDYPQEEIDPSQQQEDLWNKFIHGVFTLNDVLTQQNKEPIGDTKDPENVANMHLIVSGNAIYVVEKMKIGEDGLALPTNAQPNQPGGSPIGPEDAAVQDRPHTPDDRKAAEEIARQLELSGGKTVSAAKVFLPIEKHDNGRLPELSGPVSDELAGQIYTAVVPSSKTIDPETIEQFRQGLEEEQEHAETVGGDTRTIAHIVLDHLREDPQYYSHLRAGMGKRYKVVGTGPYRVVNVDTGQTVPGGAHDKKPDAEAHATAMNINVPDARKRYGSRPPVKVDEDYFKHCGVCPEDVAYFGAPVSREVRFEFPADHHVDEVEIVAMSPSGLPSKPALWKPEGEANPNIAERIGGPQYVRAEAYWLLDQCLGFHLVPISYVSEVDNEHGSVIWYTGGDTKVQDAELYAPEWIERAAVMDYIASQQDRHSRHNYLTHPDDSNRLVLIDNTFSFPENPEIYCDSVFCELMVGKPLSVETLQAIKLCLGDESMWRDILDVLADGGDSQNAKAAVAKARQCAQRLYDEKMITAEPTATKGWITIDGRHIFVDDDRVGGG